MAFKPLPNAGIREVLLMLIGRRQRMHVVNNSMRPTLPPGSTVLVATRAYHTTKLERGDVVVAHHPYEQGTKIIKRIEFEEEDGTYFLAGDNPDEGRVFPNIVRDQIVGKVSSVLRHG